MRRLEELHGLEELWLDLPPQRYCCNPSVTLHQGEVWINIRVVNYRLGPRIVLPDRDHVYRTWNYLMRLGSSEPVELREPLRSPPVVRRKFRGLEDLRLFSWRESLWASCTVIDRDPDVPLIALLGIDDDRLEVQFQYPGPQKNWVPLVDGEELLLLYGTDPTRVLRCNEALKAEEWRCTRAPWVLRSERGSSQAIPFDDGWIYVTHRSHWRGHRGRYLHRFVKLDRSFRVCAVSPRFYFLKPTVEFCCGLCPEPGTDRLLLSFGYEDCHAYLGGIEREAVRRLLREGPSG